MDEPPFDVQVYEEDIYRSDPDLHERLCAWIKTLGLNPAELKPYCVVVLRGGQHFFLASRILTDEDGRHRFDWARNEVVTEPVEVPIPEPNWPRPKVVA